MSQLFEWFEFAKEIADETFRYHLGEAAFYGTLGLGAYGVAAWNTRRTLHSGHLKGPTAIIQTTSYDPAFTLDASSEKPVLVPNPSSGNNFRDQKIRTEGAAFQLGDMFDRSVSRRLVTYFNKAAELCSEDSPVVYEHLASVVPKKDREKILEIIQNSIQNYISGLYRDTSRILGVNLEANQFFEATKVAPVLVREEGAIGYQLRLLLLKLNDNYNLDLPNRRDVRFLMKDGSYKAGKESVEVDRFEVLRTIAAKLQSDPDFRNMIRGYSVEIPTGQILTATPPSHGYD